MKRRQPAWQNRVVKAVKAVECWWTTSEWGVDQRTGAIALLVERDRVPEEKVAGVATKVWWWRVLSRRSTQLYVDPVHGYDGNSGLLPSTALKTSTELRRRMRALHTLASGVSVSQRGARAAARRFIRTMPSVVDKKRNKSA